MKDIVKSVECGKDTMAKIIYSEIKDCLDCPFFMKEARRGGHGNAQCWHYEKLLAAQAEKKPTWCMVDTITVKLRKK